MEIKEIIVVSFYSPPKSRKKSKLLDHILTTLHILLTKYFRAGIIIGADRNDLNILAHAKGGLASHVCARKKPKKTIVPPWRHRGATVAPPI